MNTQTSELVKKANHTRALLKHSRPPTGQHYIYMLHSKKLNLSYVGKTKQSIRKRMNMHRNPPYKCAGTQLFALGDPEWRILEIVESENAGDREEWHIANTRAATNVNQVSRAREGDALRLRLRKRKNDETRCPVKNRQRSLAKYHAKNAEAVALGYKNQYQRLKAERIAAGFII
jgi:hypothetical protein